MDDFTELELAALRDAYTVMYACNLSGVILSWADWTRKLRAAKDYDTDAFNRHPVNVLFAAKVAELTGASREDVLWAALGKGREATDAMEVSK